MASRPHRPTWPSVLAPVVQALVVLAAAVQALVAAIAALVSHR
jgi:hypothetical protein